jgi:hypothetical protein
MRRSPVSTSSIAALTRGGERSATSAMPGGLRGDDPPDERAPDEQIPRELVAQVVGSPKK